MQDFHPQPHQQIAPPQFQLDAKCTVNQGEEAFPFPLPELHAALSTLTSQSQQVMQSNNVSPFDHTQYLVSANPLQCNVNQQWDISTTSSPNSLQFPPNPVSDERVATAGKAFNPGPLTTAGSNGMPPTPPHLSLTPQSDIHVDRLVSSAPCNQIGRDSSSVAPPLLTAMTNHMEPDMMSVIGGYGANHIGFSNYNRF